ncbi:hypothetical protein GQX74_001878 [Glossina fuscipes]|nr:hypothetical protein GQX74_001878 [Glossina fuscipes]
MEKNRALLNKLGVKDLNCGDDNTFSKLLFVLVEHASVSGVIITDKIIAKAVIIPAPQHPKWNSDCNNVSSPNDNTALLCADGNYEIDFGEKKSFVKETNLLKAFNCHLEYRLNEQKKQLNNLRNEQKLGIRYAKYHEKIFICIPKGKYYLVSYSKKAVC